MKTVRPPSHFNQQRFRPRVKYTGESPPARSCRSEAERKQRGNRGGGRDLQAEESLHRTETQTLVDELIPNKKKKKKLISLFWTEARSKTEANPLCKALLLSSLVMQECFDGTALRFGAGINKESGKEILK